MDALERDFYEERRRKWRRGAFWRGFLVAAILGAVIAFLALGSADLPHARVARFDVTGMILDDPDRDELLRKIAEDDATKALILRINSPGGTTAGSEALYASVRAIAAKKPVVAVLSELAASGGYIAALSADHIVARGNTLTGSIGVIMEYPDFTELMSKMGIGYETVRSSELKAEPSPFRPTSPAARAEEQAMIEESFRWFRGLVGARRGLEGARLDAVATGGVFTGRVALGNGLVDEIGGEPEALAWLESREAGLGALPVEEREVEHDETLVGRWLGLGGASGGILGEISRGTGVKLYSLMR
ncbi:signal peptide peptidase SppA [Amaricoccus solimangrovi]|uniref:Signal peptide peptidase SppA n=1 Tax=Amaricoccus solimangrovi TaxID=2589815 RepID=A0A501WLJ4_9RHOB|nr:signal peptide peptidase SppA [Amaricoccus solimangrovi]TPE50218.1 signal peptide peptidase SppA [Amaricoccus solimangrovi]